MTQFPWWNLVKALESFDVRSRIRSESWTWSWTDPLRYGPSQTLGEIMQLVFGLGVGFDSDGDDQVLWLVTWLCDNMTMADQHGDSILVLFIAIRETLRVLVPVWEQGVLCEYLRRVRMAAESKLPENLSKFSYVLTLGVKRCLHMDNFHTLRFLYCNQF